MSCCSLQNLVSDFSTFRLEKQANQPGARSRFFAQCGHYYEAYTLKASCLENDLFLEHAKHLDAHFGHAYGSMQRLIPFQILYLHCWKDLRNALKNPHISNVELHQKVFNLVIANKRFGINFAEELKVNLKGTPESAELNNIQTLPLLYQTIMHTIAECPDKLEETQSLVEESDPNLFDFIPYQTILNLISHPQTPIPSEKEAKQDKRDELLLPIVEKIKEWRERYEKLGEIDRMVLARAKASFLKQDQKMEEDLISTLSEEGKKLFLESCAGMHQCRDQEAVSFSALTSRLFSFILEDCKLACTLAKVETFDLYSRNFAVEEALQLLKSLPFENYNQLRAMNRFSFLPDKQVDLDNSHCSHWNFYRIHSILGLATAIAEMKTCERGDSNPQEENLTTTSK